VGALTINANGSYTFVPEPNYAGAIPVATYTVSDGNGGTDTSTLTLNIAAVNDAPVDGNETNTVTEDTTLTVADGAAGDLLNNASDVDGDALSITQFTVAGNPTSFTAGQTATIAGVGALTINANGSYSFVPEPNYAGAIPVATYTVSDGNGGTDTSTLTLNIAAVNDAPVDGNETNTVTEDTTLTVADGSPQDLLANATDVEGNPLTITDFTVDGNTLTAGQTATIAGVGALTINANGSYTFVPEPNYAGAIPVATYTVSDGNGGTDTSTLTLNIAAVNDAPVDGNETNTVTEDTTLTVADGSPQDLLANATDVEGNPLTITDFTVDGNTLTAGQTATIAGVGALTINANGSYTFVPEPNYAGAIPVATYTVSDGNGGTDTSTLTLNIAAVNDAPVDGNETNTVTEDTTLTVADGSPQDLLANATDVEGNPLTITDFTVDGNTLTAGQTATIAGVGALTINANGSYTFVPEPNYAGAIPVATYTVSDGNGGTDTSTLTLNITAVNDPSVLTPDTDTTPEDIPATGNVLGNDVDVDDVLSVSGFTVAGDPTSYTPGQTATIAGVGTFTLGSNGDYTFTPETDWNGTVPQVTYTTNTGSSSTLDITVTPLDDTPSISDDAATTPEDTPVIIDVLDNDSDADGDTLTVTQIDGQAATVGVPVPVANGTATLNPDGTITFTPAPDYNGPVTFTYTATDGTTPVTADVNVTVTPVNDAPVALDDSTTTPEDTPVTILVRSNDSDVDNDPLTVISFSDPANGSVVLDGSGNLVYTPDLDFTGTDTFTYVISDGNGGTDLATVTVNVGGVNDAPEANPDTNSTTEDVPLNVSAANGVILGAVGTDTDIDGDTLSVSAVSFGGTAGTVGSVLAGAWGNLTLNANGSYTYVPNAAAQGLDDGESQSDVFTYTVTDPGGLTATTTLTITVNGLNDAPVAVDDNRTTPEDTPVTIPVLGNDTDVDGETLTVTQIDGQAVTPGDTVPVANGTATLNPDGTVTFTPDPGFNGVVDFTYTVSDGTASDTANVRVVVDDVNDPPVAQDNVVAGSEDSPVSFDPRSNDTDPDGDPLSITEINGTPITTTTPVTLPEGVLSLNANGTLTFTPNPNFNGNGVTFEYTIDDGRGGTDTATVTMNIAAVNDLPVDGNETNTVTEDTTLTVADGAAGDLLNNASDVDGDALSITQFTVAGNPTSFTAGQTATIAGVGALTINANGSYTFVPEPNYAGAIPVATYTVSDGNGGTDTSTLTLNITAVNDPSVLTPDTDTTPEDIPATGNVLGNDVDVDDVLSVSGFTVAGDPTSYTPGQTATIAGVGTFTLGSNGDYTFTPETDWNGTVPQVTYTTNTGSSSTLDITVTPLDDTPSISDDAATTPEDTPVIIDVLDNDSDADGDTLTVTQIDGQAATVGVPVPVANGTATLNPDGTITFTPAPDYNGPVTFTYTATDGTTPVTADVNVTVTPVNDAPVALDDSTTTPEDTPVTILVRSNDSDVDNDPLTVISFSDPANGSVVLDGSGNLVYTPDLDFTGTDTFTYVISDGNGGTDLATVTVNVGGVNDAPEANPDTNSTTEDVPLNVSAANGVILGAVGTDTDIDGDTLSVSAVSFGGTAGTVGSVLAGAWGNLTLNANGSYTYVPNAAAQGLDDGESQSDVFTYTVTDPGGLTATTTLTITVNGLNDAPVAVDDNRTTPEDTPVTIPVLGNDTDVDGETLTVTQIDGQAVTPGDTVPVANGTATLNPDGTVTFTPDPGFNGVVDFTYTVSDGTASDTANVRVVVDDVNDPPVAQDNVVAGSEDSPVSFDPRSNDTDPDGDPLSITEINGTPITTTTPVTLPEGVLSLNANGTLTFTPNPNFNGNGVTFEYTIDDGRGGTDTATVTMNIAAVNDLPVDGNETNTVTEDTTLTVADGAAGDLLNNASDVDGDALSITQFTVAGNPTSFTAGQTATIAGVGALTINANGSYTFVPEPNYAGAIPVATYTVSDGNGGTDTSTLTLTMAAVNDLPVATDNVDTTVQDVTVSGNVITENTGDGVDSDVDGDALTVSAFTVGGVAGTVGTPVAIAGVGQLTLNSDGSYSFDPEPDFVGDVPEVVYTLSDGNGGTDTATLNITVTPLSETPSVVGDAATTPEDTPVTIDVLGNDDPGSEGPLTITEINGTPISAGSPVTLTDPVTGLPIGVVSLNEGNPGDPTDDVLVFTPEPGYNGPVTFDYTVEDRLGNELNAPVTIDVTPVNDPPTAGDDSTVTPANTPATIDVLGNDADPDGDPLTVSAVNGQPITEGGAPVTVPNGTVALVGGQLVFTPTPGFTGPANFGYTVTDPSGATDSATVTVNVGQANLPPVAQNDTNATNEDTPLTVSAADGVIQSGGAAGGVDSDPNGDSLSVSAVDGAPGGVGAPVLGDYGTLVLNVDGSYSYTPTAAAQALPAGASVQDVFTYTITDPSGQTATATLTIDVTGLNDAPVAEDNSAITTPDTNVSGNLLTDDGNGPAAGGVDSDPDGDTLTVSGFTAGGLTGTPGVPLTIPNVGELTINPDGSYTFDPVPGFEGAVPPVVYTVDDGNGGTDSATLSLVVDASNDPPVAQNDNVRGQEDQPVTFNPLTNDSDPEGQPLQITQINGVNVTPGTPVVITDPVSGDPIGELVLNPDGTLTFTPEPDFNTTTPIPVVYTVADPDGATATATINLLVDPVNDLPVATDNVDTTVQDVTVSGNVITENTGDGVDSDVDGDALTVSAFTVGGVAGTVGTPVAIAGVGQLTLNSDGSYSFDPEPDFVGDVPEVVYTLSDGNGGTDTATLNITVTPLSETPSVVGDAATTPEDTPVTIDVLGNDDPGSEGPLTITEINGTPISAGSPVTLTDPVTGLPIGVVSLNEGNPGDPTDDVLVFTPEPGYNGPVTFDYTVEDRLGNELNAPVTIDVTPVNDPPTAGDDSTVTPANTPATIDVLGNDADPDGDPLTVSAVNGQPITEGGAPVTVPNGTVALVGGQLVFTPTPGFTGPANFGYTVTDPSGATDSATVTVNVGQANLPPVAQNDTNATNEDTPLTVSAADGVIQSGGAAGGVDSDPNGDSLSVSAVDGAPGGVGAPVLGDYGTLVLNVDGSYSYTPTAAAQALPAGASVQDVFTYTITDPSGQTATATLTIDVTGLNDAPVAEDNSAITTPDTNVSGNLLTDDGNGPAAGGVDSDPDGDTLTVSGFTAGGLTGTPGVPLTIPNVGELTINPDGSYTFDPVPGFEGAVPPVVYTVDDGNGGTDSATLSLVVDASNDPPVAQNDNVRGQEDQPVTFNPLTNDSDPEGQPLQITQINGVNVTPGTPVVITDPVSGDPIGELVLNPDGTLTFTPEPDFNTTTPIPVVYTVADPDGATATATIRITVVPVNDAPVATDNGPIPTAPNTPVSGNVLTDNNGSGVDSDVDGDPLTVTGFAVDTNGDGVPENFTAGQTATITDDTGNPIGTLVIGANGAYTFTPSNGYAGPVPAATYTISDGQGATDSAVLSFGDVPNAAPVANNDGPLPTAVNTPVTGNVLTNDSDPNGDPLTVTGFTVSGVPGTFGPGDTATIPGVGTLVINQDGSFAFTPVPGYTGPIPSATYTVSDGSATSSAVLSFAAIPSEPLPPAPPPPPPAPPPPPPPPPPPAAPRPEEPSNPDWREPESEAPRTPSILPPSPGALHVLYAVAGASGEQGLASSPLGTLQASAPLLGEAMAQLPDSLLFESNSRGEHIGLIRELGYGEVQVVRPSLYVQHAVRHQPISTDPSLWVQHAVRSSQLESMLRSASLDANNSATVGVSTLIDPFALGAPQPEGPVKLAEVETPEPRQEAVAKAVPVEAAPQEPVKVAPVQEKVVEKPRAAAGLRNQLQQFAKDRAVSARPITRSTVSS
jgi:large repetitive protein